jgi:methionine synthase I (cobalamin-dependent)
MSLLEELYAAAPVLLDGAWGTQMQARGLKSGECPDEWNLTHPERVREVARAYVDAGSRIILSNTFRANRISLAGEGLAERAAEIARAGAAISREAAAGTAYVFASIGPSGKILMSGDVTEEALSDAFVEQAKALAEGGADGLAVETMSDLDEARIAIAAAKATGLPVAATMVFDTGKNKDRTMMGATPERSAETLAEAGVDIIGANCGCGIAGYVEICRRLRAAAGRPVWIKANAGLPELVDGRPVYRMTAAEFASYVPALKEAGAGFMGGCCGTSPDFIRAMREALA